MNGSLGVLPEVKNQLAVERIWVIHEDSLLISEVDPGVVTQSVQHIAYADVGLIPSVHMDDHVR